MENKMKALQVLVLAISLVGLTSCAHHSKKSCSVKKPKCEDGKSCDLKKKKSCCEGKSKSCHLKKKKA